MEVPDTLNHEYSNYLALPFDTSFVKDKLNPNLSAKQLCWPPSLQHKLRLYFYLRLCST